MAKAVIFDMDGVISDTQILHVAADVAVMRRYGIKLTEKDIGEKFAGIIDKEMFGNLFKMYGISTDIQEAIKEKWKIMMARADDSIKPLVGVLELIDNLKKEKFRLAVASSSPLIFIDTVLSKLNIKDKFEVIASGEEVQRGKPNPEIFLLTARRLKIPPNECLVIEDSLNGMIAAKRAGMRCIGFVRKNKITASRNSYPADLLINDLRKLTVERIKKL